MNREYIKAVIILPGTALVYVPGILLWLGEWSLRGPADPLLWPGAGLLLAGIWIAAWTNKLFLEIGKGTPGPWAPPKNMVVAGPYAYVRNPMITAVLLMLGGEALVFSSPAIGWWLAVFFIVNNIYFPLVEEPGLEKRFGDEYREYKNNVPRWWPRLTPWERPGDSN